MCRSASPLTPVSGHLSRWTPHCLASSPGTRIATHQGEVAVEVLKVGDLIRVVDGRDTPIVWIGHRRVDCARHPHPELVWPVRVRAGSFGPGEPRRDLLLSPDHAVLVEDVLVPVKHLINGTSVAQFQMAEVMYYHVELAAHDILLAEGLPAESYLDTGDRSNFSNGVGAVALHPNFSAHMWEGFGCAPLVVFGPKIESVRQLLRDRARLTRPAKRGRVAA